MKPPVEVTLTPVWSWLANSTLKRTGEEFQGKTINVWSFKVNKLIPVIIIKYIAIIIDTIIKMRNFIRASIV